MNPIVHRPVIQIVIPEIPKRSPAIKDEKNRSVMLPDQGRVMTTAPKSTMPLNFYLHVSGKNQFSSGENRSEIRFRISCIFSGLAIPIVLQMSSFSRA
jgi:hypothetical protein